MLLSLGSTAIVAAALSWALALPRLRESLPRLLRAISDRGGSRRGARQMVYDPGRELRAEQRARELLRSCVNEEEWAMYRDLGFLRVCGPGSVLPCNPSPSPSSSPPSSSSLPSSSSSTTTTTATAARGADGARYAYLIYPHRPIVAYVPPMGALLNEYCVAFPDESRPFASARLPDADDVLAKWMALTADERRLIAGANMHLPGRQIDPRQVREDLARLARWERERAAHRRSAGAAHRPAAGARRSRAAGSVRAA